jgi:hypothetical protein
MLVHFGSTFPAMEMPAISEEGPAVPGTPWLGGAPEDEVQGLTARDVRELRPHLDPARAARPAPPRRSAAWEILAGALLVAGWALLWSFLLTFVVKPDAAPRHRAAPVSVQWSYP